jgi:hypothetical protein
VIVVGVLVLLRTITWLLRLTTRRTWLVADPVFRQRPRRHRRLGNGRRRRVAAKRARELVAALANGWSHDPIAHLSDGAIVGEKSLYSAAPHTFRYGPLSPHAKPQPGARLGPPR